MKARARKYVVASIFTLETEDITGSASSGRVPVRRVMNHRAVRRAANGYSLRLPVKTACRAKGRQCHLARNP